MIVWKEEYALGVELIDEQHKKLFEIANRAIDIIKDDLSVDKYDHILAVVNELKEYTIFHFKSEEEYMEQIGYRKLFSHKVEHADFIDKVNNVNLEYLDENQDEYLMGVLEFVLRWIDEHILEKDKLILANAD